MAKRKEVMKGFRLAPRTAASIRTLSEMNGQSQSRIAEAAIRPYVERHLKKFDAGEVETFTRIIQNSNKN